MKTEKEWMKDLCSAGGLGGVVLVGALDIRNIQADALRHAAQLIHDMSRGTKSVQRALALDEAHDLLLTEATNLIVTK